MEVRARVSKIDLGGLCLQFFSSEKVKIQFQVQDAKEYLQTELQHSQMLLEKLQEYSERLRKTVEQIDTAYEHVFQRINAKEQLLCDKVSSRGNWLIG